MYVGDIVDKLSENVMKYIYKYPIGKIFIISMGDDDVCSIARSIGAERESVRASIDFLVSQGKLEYIYSKRGKAEWFRLTHVAEHKIEFHWIGIRKYLLDNLIAILSFFIAAGALIVAIIALNN